MIETPRLRLRPPYPGDASALQALMTPAISQWLGTWPVPFTLEMAQTRIERSLDAMARKRALIFAIEFRSNLAGWIGGASPDSRQGNFGYWLGEAFRGQALMQEAAPIFLANLRTHFALASVEATCHASNYASAKVLAVCGLDRVRHADGTCPRQRPQRTRRHLATYVGHETTAGARHSVRTKHIAARSLHGDVSVGFYRGVRQGLFT